MQLWYQQAETSIAGLLNTHGESSYKDVFVFLLVVDKLVVLGDDFFDDLLGVGSERIVVVLAALALESLLCLLYLLFLFIVLGFLQTHEILTIDLVELLLDIVDNERDFRDQNELERVDTSVGHLESLIKCDELALKSGDRDQDLEELGEFFTSVLDRLSTHAKTEKVAITGLINVFESEDRDMHTSDIVVLHGHADWRANSNVINDSATEISRGEVGLSHTHTRFPVIDTHAYL